MIADHIPVSPAEGRPVSPRRLTPVAVAVTLLLSSQVQAAEVFNVHALELDNQTVAPGSLSSFESGNQAPGTYHADIYINGLEQETRDVTFVAGPDGKLQPQLTVSDLARYGVMVKSIPSLSNVPAETVLVPLEKYIPEGSTDFNFNQQKLLLSVPQASMGLAAQGAVDPKYWDEGIPALMSSYSFTGANTWQDEGGRDDSYFLNLRSGANLGGWRLRNYSTWNYTRNSGNDNSYGSSGSESHWNSINTYVQHDVAALKGQFTAGDSYTPSDVFDSVQFRGAQLASDDNMLPDSLRGFAPTVKGIANSNAQVTIKQNGSVIYQTYVPPGPFSINDLYPTSASGDLQVTVKEADGSERSFVQPFANVPVMQREGRLKYAMTLGKYRSQSDHEDEPNFGQGTIIYGLPHDMTLYGGTQNAQHYDALAGGVGFGLGELGSISVDMTQAWTDLQNGNDKQGQSYRFQYSKDIQATDSTVTLAGYRYSTEGFYTFQEALDYQAYDEGYYDTDLQYNKRSKVQVDLTQNLMGGDWGTLSFSGYQQDYWNEDGYERNLNVSYNNSWNGISWSLMFTYTEAAGMEQDNNQQYALNVSIPLSKWLPNAYVNNSMTVDKHGQTHNQVGLNGTALADNNLSYSVAEGYDNHGGGNSGMVSSDYKGTYGEVNAGYNYNKDSKQMNYGLQGSLIAHEHGLTLSQPVSDMAAMALVRAPGADGAKVQNNTGVYTDWRGYTVVPYLSPYRRTRVALDPGTLKEGVDMDQNVQQVVPTAGALVLADFKTRVGARVLMTLMQGGKPVPFGATVSLGDEGDNTGIVGDGGQVYLSGVPQNGSLTAKWGNGATEQCHATFTLSSEQENNTNGQAAGVIPAVASCG